MSQCNLAFHERDFVSPRDVNRLSNARKSREQRSIIVTRKCHNFEVIDEEGEDGEDKEENETSEVKSETE